MEKKCSHCKLIFPIERMTKKPSGKYTYYACKGCISKQNAVYRKTPQHKLSTKRYQIKEKLTRWRGILERTERKVRDLEAKYAEVFRSDSEPYKRSNFQCGGCDLKFFSEAKLMDAICPDCKSLRIRKL